jgi:hypothetical protein
MKRLVPDGALVSGAAIPAQALATHTDNVDGWREASCGAAEG